MPYVVKGRIPCCCAGCSLFSRIIAHKYRKANNQDEGLLLQCLLTENCIIWNKRFFYVYMYSYPFKSDVNKVLVKKNIHSDYNVLHLLMTLSWLTDFIPKMCCKVSASSSLNKFKVLVEWIQFYFDMVTMFVQNDIKKSSAKDIASSQATVFESVFYSLHTVAALSEVRSIWPFL